MKAYLDFDFDIIEDRERFMRMIVADGLCSALWDIEDYLRGEDKHGEGTAEQQDKISEIRQRVSEIISENNINLEEIWS